ncbi:MAG: hypothetical protein EBT85_05760 [Synechococcaceae bacterium WB5_2B_268]|nr:hypothetical protein [Synechococcaceae bacterium WB5_2B_268]
MVAAAPAQAVVAHGPISGHQRNQSTGPAIEFFQGRFLGQAPDVAIQRCLTKADLLLFRSRHQEMDQASLFDARPVCHLLGAASHRS